VIRCAGVEPVTEHSLVLFCSDAAPVMSWVVGAHPQARPGQRRTRLVTEIANLEGIASSAG